ncbi:MAG: hypothetical protein AMXMBFR13_18870 [Phycisphaerae bacterium]
MHDYCWLLTRDYAEPSALKLVGDHFALTSRQRVAVMRSSCSDQSLRLRRERRIASSALQDSQLLLDGYNVLITVEAALAGGVIFEGRDGCYRDLASLHGTFRTVEETAPAIERVGSFLAGTEYASCVWYLDAPVSNSSRLKALILQCARAHGWRWQVEVVRSPDAVLQAARSIIATADSVVLDHCHQWFNLAREIIRVDVPGARVVDLSIPEGFDIPNCRA